MPYPAGHRNAVRKKIVQSARRLFNRHGFDGVSLQQIMAGAGLTHGGFYSYFASKSDLYVEVLGCFFTDPEWKNCGKASMWTSPPARWARKWSAPIFRANILKTSKIPAP